MTSITELQHATSQLPADIFIGNISWFGISDQLYSFDTLETLFEDNDLDKRFLPNRNTAHDVFVRATRIIDARKFTTTDGNRANLLVRNVTSDEHHYIQQLVCEVVNASNVRLGYETVATLTFFRGHHGGNHRTLLVRTRDFTDDINTAVDEALRDIEDEFNQRLNTLAANKLRQSIRNYYQHIMSIPVRPSVHFVPSTSQNELNGLVNVLRGMGCDAQVLPLVNVTDQLEMVQNAYYDTQKKELVELTVEMGEALKKGKVRAAEITKLKEKYAAVMGRAAAYEKHLSCQSSITAGVQDAAKATMNNLVKVFLGGAE